MAMKDLIMLNFLNSEKLDQSFDNLSSFINEREEAYKNFKNIGIPSKRNERWKYTDLKNYIRGIDFSLCNTSIDIETASSDKIDISDIDYFNKNRDDYLKPAQHLNDEAVIYLNLSYSNLFRCITIKESLDKPILINIDSLGEGVSFPRFIFNIYPNVNVEFHFFNRGGEGFINQLIEFNIDNNSTVNIFRVNESSSIHSETFMAYLSTNSNLFLTNLSLSKNKSRFQAFNSFNGEHSSSVFKSVSIPFEGCKDDFLVYNNHIGSNCRSNVGMRSILEKGVECSFQALIDIENKIKNSKAEQDCRAILLDEKASMNAKPEMKIFNNDVVCKHGTTIGSLNKDQIFYLNSRGLSKSRAEKILLQGIISEYIPEHSPLINFLPENYK
jgi:Fe-S cluster assembly protein SufD